MAHHEKAEVLPFGGWFLAVQRQGDGAVERPVVGVAVERDDQGAARLQHGDDLEQVCVRFRAGQRRCNDWWGGAVVVLLMRGCRRDDGTRRNGPCVAPGSCRYAGPSATAVVGFMTKYVSP